MRLAIGAVVLAVVWTLAMIAWSWPVDVPAAVIWAMGGAIVGLLWYLAMDWWMRRRTGSGPA
jgi:hypothetical protein